MQTNKLPLVGALMDRLRRRSDHESVKAAMSSKGDVTKVEGYKTMAECLVRLAAIDAGSGSIGKPLRVAQRTHAVLLKHKAAFTASFDKSGSEAVRLVYANTVAALWHTVSLICADGVTFVKSPTGSYGAVVNKSGIDGMSGSVIVTRLERLNDAADKYGFTQTVTETAQAVESELFREADLGFLAVAGLAVAGLVALLLISRDLAEKFYSLRGTFSRWLEVQARFLEVNASAIDGKPGVRAKQEEYATRLRALADRIRVDDADTEKDAVKAIQQDDHSLERDSLPRAAQAQNFSAALL
jgi:hypothetical protein